MVWVECEVCKAKSAYKTAKDYPSEYGWDTSEVRSVTDMWNRRATNE